VIAELMSSMWPLIAAFAAGIALGSFYFGGLWLTVNRLQQFRHPAPVFAVSFVVRTAVVIAGIYFLTAADWRQIASCMVGFIAIRTVLTRRWGPSTRANPKSAVT
jgi:F1F0 ATPase subunit 2